MKTLKALVALAFLTPAACSDSKKPEPDGEEKTKSVVEYTVTLDRIKLLKFAPHFAGDVNPDLFIRTAVSAEGIGGVQQAVFAKPGTWSGGWEDIPVAAGGTVVPITAADGKPGLIFKHVACAPARQLQVLIDVGDLDSELPESLSNWLTQAGGIGGLVNPPVAGIIAAAGPPVINAIRDEMGKMGQFPQVDTKVGPGPHQIKSAEAEGRQYEASIVVAINTLKQKCTQETLEKLRKGKS